MVPVKVGRGTAGLLHAMIAHQFDLLQPFEDCTVFDQSTPDIQELFLVVDQLIHLQRAFLAPHDLHFAPWTNPREKGIALAVQWFEAVLSAEPQTDGFLPTEVVIVDYPKMALVQFRLLEFTRIENYIVVGEITAFVVTP